MNDQERKRHLERRIEQLREGAPEAVRREVEWLERHNFPVWIWEDGRVVDASKNDRPRPRQ